MLVWVISLVGGIVGLVGWFAKKSIAMLLIGFAITRIETIVEWKNYNKGAKINIFIVFAVGCIIGLFLKTPFWVVGVLALLISDMLLHIVTLLGLGAAGISTIVDRKK